MASKALVLLGLFAVLLVVSEMAAASSGTVNSESKETVQPDQRGGGYGDNGGNYNNGGGYQGGGGNNGGGYQGGGGNNGGGYQGGGGGRGGHGGGGYQGGGGGRQGGGGGYCRHGCCYRGYRGCSRCCSYAGEAVQTQPGH